MNPKDKIHSSWKPITRLFDTDKGLVNLNTNILPKKKFYPDAMNIFNVFQMPLEDIKVVILGQDPYPKEGQAIGYAFAVSEGIPKPVSLRIIEREIGHEIDKTLFSWRQQGVFLLNTALTVEAGKPGSHAIYWRNFICNVINYLSHINSKVIFVLWGSKAKSFEPYINIDSPVLKASHPASEAYARGNTGFYGCNHFHEVNRILRQQGKQIINW